MHLPRSSRDGHAHLITLSYLPFCHFLVLLFGRQSFPQWPHKGLPKQSLIFYITSKDTSALPLQFYSQRQSVEMHDAFRVMSLAIDLNVDRHPGPTSHWVRQVLQKNSRRDHILKCGGIYLKNQDQRLLSGTTSTLIEFIRDFQARKSFHASTRGAGTETVVAQPRAYHGTSKESGFTRSRARLALVSINTDFTLHAGDVTRLLTGYNTRKWVSTLPVISRCTPRASQDCLDAITRKVSFDNTLTLYPQRTSPDWSHPTVWVALFRANVSERLSSSREELLG